MAARILPAAPGLYAIFVDKAEALPSPFREELVRKNTLLIYVGIATTSLLGRLVDQDLRHESPSTFFRGIGAILGFRPPRASLIGRKNQNNYVFSPSDTRSIIRWIDAHLALRWLELTATEAKLHEGPIIANLRPLLNWSHNPDRLGALHELRKECRLIAQR